MRYKWGRISIFYCGSGSDLWSDPGLTPLPERAAEEQVVLAWRFQAG